MNRPPGRRPRVHGRRRWILAAAVLLLACAALLGAMLLEARSLRVTRVAFRSIGAKVEDFVLLVDHSPDVAESIGGTPVDLVLAGHTHRGQVAAFGLWAPFVPSRYGNKYRTGLVTDGPVPVFITTGVGTIVAPLRLFAPPEIVLLTLRRE